MANSITVNPLTNNPTAAWTEISKYEKVTQLPVKIPSKPVEGNKVRFVCMSDTHSLTHNLMFDIPYGDVFLHAGDFTKTGQRDEVKQFSKWLSSLPHKHKIVIAGNHELSFDPKFAHIYNHHLSAFHTKEDKSAASEDVKQYLKNCTYLQDSGVDLYGIKIYGSPWQPTFGDWAFNLDRGEECLAKWDLIPCDTDILITHAPPLGHGDLTSSNVRAGCVELLATVQQRVKPKYHIFGHIHEGYGVTSDNKTIFINASTCDKKKIPKNLPVVFDFPLPEGCSIDRSRRSMCSIN